MGDAAPLRLLVVHDDDLGMRFGGDHPTDRRRHQLAVALCRESGILDAEGVERRDAPGPLDDEALARVFAPAFIRAVHRYDANPILAAAPEAAQWGIGGDNNAYDGMHHDSARACAACAVAALAVAEGSARAALVPSGGAHHGLANRASGFGIYNETAIAIQVLLDAGMERVAYIDLDVHHGNGTQWIFYDDPRVLTVSVHESGRHLFPGSGFAAETGGAQAPGSAVNVALPPFAGDAAYRAAMDRVVVPDGARLRARTRSSPSAGSTTTTATRSATCSPRCRCTPTSGGRWSAWPTRSATGSWSRWGAAATTPARRRRGPGRLWRRRWRG